LSHYKEEICDDEIYDIDPMANVNFLPIFVVDLQFKKGAKELAKFYKLSSDHQIAMYL